MLLPSFCDNDLIKLKKLNINPLAAYVMDHAWQVLFYLGPYMSDLIWQKYTILMMRLTF